MRHRKDTKPVSTLQSDTKLATFHYALKWLFMRIQVKTRLVDHPSDDAPEDERYVHRCIIGHLLSRQMKVRRLRVTCSGKQQ